MFTLINNYKIKEWVYLADTNKTDIRNVVRESYGKIADGKVNDEGCCCGSIKIKNSVKEISNKIGYSDEEILKVPEGANMGLGCGNPQLIAEIKEGEIVIDLGSGGGIDCFLASKTVGPKGYVIGVDMTPEMVSKSRTLARDHGYTNVDFRLGEIENLPVADNTADVIISNCVINLSPRKQRVYNEAYRILKKGGRLAISDIILVKELTEEMKQDEKLYCG
jgi:arsenite methyltransferase